MDDQSESAMSIAETVASQAHSPVTLLSSDEVRPQSFATRRKSTRLAQYRRKLRRQRNRRMAVAVATVIALITMGIAYKAFYNRQFTFQNQILAQDSAVNVRFLDRWLDSCAENMRWVLGQGDAATIEKDKTDKKVPQKAEPEAKQAEEAAVVEEPEPVVPIDTTPQETKTISEPIVQQQIAIVPRRDTERRPILCNLPLAYILHPKCWRLASRKPIFNLQGLIQDMIQ